MGIGLTFAPFSDGYDNGYPNVTKSLDKYREFYASFIALGSEFLAKIFTARAKERRPFSRIIYTSVLSWVGIGAKKLNALATLLWIQPATLLDIYYYYFTDYRYDLKNCLLDDQPIELPRLPFLVGTREIPLFLFSSGNLMDWLIQTMKEHVESITSETNESVLVNTFDVLELEALRAIKNNVNMVGIGPLIPSYFFDGEDPLDTSYGGDLRHCSKDYMDWLDFMPNASVVYVAFGSYSELSNQMMEEIAKGLVKSKRPFLWIIRDGEFKSLTNLSCKEKLEKQGKIVSWCSQVEVLQHPSLGCFLTHCGWTSTLESLVSGIPIVACPLWTDQGCNSKFAEDVWKIDVRVNENEEVIIEGDEFKRCVEIVKGVGKEGEELRKNAKKLRDLAKDAIKEDGSFNVNLKAYVHEVLGNLV
ncbi:hypothetical protein K7X08_016818 [Anisodus acutangulus]|uniref:Glycosyltransferase n=1 Tax=Anisodus acutangulus TaxID=402998 RepID=A0A9Q1LQ30_9SOLA|nr:hypothetical protein K7X08_016818 [Anisodus acutangulus]